MSRQAGPSPHGAAVVAVFNSHRWQVIVVVIVLLGLFDFSKDFLMEWWKDTKLPPLYRAIPLPVFVVALWWSVRAARETLARVVPKIEQRHATGGHGALVLFLSPVGQDRDTVGQLMAGREPVTVDSVRSKLKGSWRMPIEAIAHQGTPLKVAVICSADTVKQTGDIDQGTYRDNQFGVFQQLVDHIWGEDVKVVDATAGYAGMQRGVDFEKGADLVQVIEKTYQCLYRDDFDDQAIILDVTGGSKICSATGAAVSQAEGRQIQYVSTRDYTVQEYDMTYQGA
jgi:hypothetical protein